MTDLITKIANFLNALTPRIRVRREIRPQVTFLPGIRLSGRTLFITPDNPRFKPGDLLHEAGHIAVMPSMFRHRMQIDIEKSTGPAIERYMEHHAGYDDPVVRAIIQAGEQEAIAWSYAAAAAARINPTHVFHEGAYGGDEIGLLHALDARAHPGIHGLQAGGMTTTKLFPKMLRWMQI